MNIKKSVAKLKFKIKILSKKNLFVSSNNWEVTPTVSQVDWKNMNGETSSDNTYVDKRLDSNPIDVVNELVQHQVPLLDTTNIDKKIKSINTRIKLLHRQKLPTPEESLALQYLAARKIFLKDISVLDAWPIVSENAINDLLKKHKLVRIRLGSGAYESICPNEALQEIEKYQKVWDQLWPGLERAEIILIIKESVYNKIQEIQRKKDPILLAKSPLGNWWHLLGAWDKEVDYVADIIYTK
jgi:hypothetical protein